MRTTCTVSSRVSYSWSDDWSQTAAGRDTEMAFSQTQDFVAETRLTATPRRHLGRSFTYITNTNPYLLTTPESHVKWSIMRSKTEQTLIDLSVDLSDEIDWRAGTLRTFEHRLDISAWAYESLSGLLAVGTYLFLSFNLICTYFRYQQRYN